MHDLRLPEHPELIDMSTSQPSDESRQLSRDVSGNETVLGSHHLRMMQGLTGKQTDPEPAVPSAQASSELYTPESDIMGGAAAVNETQDGTIADSGTVDGTIDQSSHGSDTETESPTAASSPNPLRPAGEIQDSVAPYSNLAPTVHTAATKTTDSFSDQAIKKVLRQLDGFGKRDLLLGQYQVLGRQQQRLGGAHPACCIGELAFPGPSRSAHQRANWLAPLCAPPRCACPTRACLGCALPTYRRISITVSRGAALLQ